MSTCYSIRGFNYVYISVLYFLTVFVCYLFGYFVENNYAKIIIILSILIISAIFILANKDSFISWENNQLLANLNYINNQMQSYGFTYFDAYQSMFIVIVPLITLCLYFLYEVGAKSAVQFLLTFEIIMFWYLQYYNEVIKCLFPFIAVSIFTMVINKHMKLINNLERKRILIHINRYMFIISLMLLSLAVSFMSTLLPNKTKMNYGDSIIEGISGDSGTISSKSKAFTERYGLDYSGYSSTEQKLGGPIKLDTSVAFNVESDAAYYLVGDVKDQYTGYSWKKSQVQYSKGSNISPHYQTLDVQKGLPNNIFNDSERKTITIIPDGLITTSIFVPKYPVSVLDHQGTTFYNEDEGTFLSTKALNNEYTVDFYDVDLSKLTSGAIVAYNNSEYSKYLQLPSSITQRTIDLVYDIVKNCNTNEEKIKAIRDYLSKNYKYTLNASVVPEGKDFVDYFLFEDKKGYCVHFATAMTIMYRIAGIPARFTEGFKMDDNANSRGIYEVRNSQAHAWCEYMVKPNVWEISDAAPTPEENMKQDTNENNSAPAEAQQNQQQSNPQNTNTPSTKNNDPQATKVKVVNHKLDTKIVIYSSVTIALIVIILLISLIQNKRKAAMLKNKSAIKLYIYVNKRLKRYSRNKPYNVTDKEFIKTLPRQLYLILNPLIEAVYEEFYGGKPKEELDKKYIYSEFERYLKQESGSNSQYLFKKLFVFIRRLK